MQRLQKRSLAEKGVRLEMSLSPPCIPSFDFLPRFIGCLPADIARLIV